MLGSPIDNLGRFKRHRDPQPRAARILKSNKLLELLRFLYRHGPLPTNILFEFYGTSGEKFFTSYLSRLYDGVCLKYDEHTFDEKGRDITHTDVNHKHDAVQQYLARPRDYRSANMHYDQIVHDLTDEALATLDVQPFRRDPDIHRLMGACITASIEIAVRELGGTYISRQTILSESGRPLRISDSLVPDELFGLSVGGKKHYFVCEWDRATEALTSSSARETIRSKLEAYQSFFEKRKLLHKILFATVGEGRMQNVLDLVRSEFPSLASRVLCKTFPEFSGRDWTIPKSAYPEILKSWRGVNGPFDLI